jgi:lipid-binding SYLF domain-containing protein
MTEAALNYLENSDGWEVGIGPSIVIVDTGAARTLTTTTAQDAIYAFIFSQKGLMAGVGLQGSKITKIER